MRWGDDTEEAFPPRHPREPGGLRQDILDEIADHLACAAEREADRGGENDNEETVWGRVLERFGNPDAIARKLWWDEMRETVMREWIQTGVMVVVAVAVVVFMALVMRQMTSANQAVLEALKSNATAVNPLVTLKVKVTRGSEDGPAAEGVRVILNGAAFGGESTFVSRSADGTGKLQFGPMQPGQYRIYSFDPQSGLTSNNRTETLFAGETIEQISLVAPDTQLVPTHLTFDTPFTLSGNRALQLWIESTWGHGEATWNKRTEVLTDGTRWWTRYTDPSGDEQPPSLSDVDSQGVVTNSTWKDVLLEGDTLRMSGAIEAVYVALLEEGDDKRVRRVLFEHLDKNAFRPAADGSSYRLNLPEEFRRYFFDLKVEEHAAARGIELEEHLWRSIRNQFPDHLVDEARLVARSATGQSLDLQLLQPENTNTRGENMFVESATIFDYTRFPQGSVGLSLVSIIEAPTSEAMIVPPGSQVILALFVSSGNAEEFENDFQAWPVFNDVISQAWPSVLDNGDSGLECVMALGTDPILTQTSDSIVETTRNDAWLLLDMTAMFSGEGGESRAAGALLRWQRTEPEYDNSLTIVSAGAKLLENKPLRPMWLVLKPMETKEATAVQ